MIILIAAILRPFILEYDLAHKSIMNRSDTLEEIFSIMKKNLFDRFADWAVCFTGSAGAFIGASLLVIIWAATGPMFKFSEVWQMVINTGTTIITFLMVFLIQKAQNKDSKAIQIKLNELIASHEQASNKMVDIEDLTEEELDELHKFYERIGKVPPKKQSSHK